MYKAVGFDLGGVIIYYSIPDQLEWIAEKFRVPAEAVNKAYYRLRPLLDVDEIDNQEFWRRLLQDSGSTADPVATEHYWSDSYIKDNPLIEGMLDLVERLKRGGYGVGLLSNTDREHAEVNRNRHIFEHFDQVLLSDELRLRKPQPEAFEALADALGVELSELVFVDDLSENVAAARALGIYAIEFTGRGPLIKELESLGLKF